MTSYSFENGRLERIRDYGMESAIQFFQDQRQGLYVSEGVLFLTDIETGVTRPFLSRLPDKILDFRISLDNRWIYYLRESVEADIWLLRH